jgi:hypothetical protein
MNTNPLFVVRQAGAGGYFSNGTTLSSHPSREEANAALAGISSAHQSKYGACRVEDWTPTAAQVEAWLASQE